MMIPAAPPPQAIEQIAPALPARQAARAGQVETDVGRPAIVPQLPPDARAVRQPAPSTPLRRADGVDQDRATAAVLEPSTDPSLPAARELGPDTINAIGREVLQGRPPAPR